MVGSLDDSLHILDVGHFENWMVHSYPYIKNRNSMSNNGHSFFTFHQGSRAHKDHLSFDTHILSI